MEATAVRHIDPAEIPQLVREALQIADDEIALDADRAVLLPVILELLGRRSVMPVMPALANLDPRILGLGRPGGG